MTRRIALATAVVACAAAAVAFFILKPSADRQLAEAIARATDPAERDAIAQKIIDRGQNQGSTAAFEMAFRDGNPAVRLSLIRTLSASPDASGKLTPLMFSHVETCDAETIDAVAVFVSALDPTKPDDVRSALLSCFEQGPTARELACRLAEKPELKLGSLAVKCFRDPDANVRKAAVMAVGTQRDVVNEDDLFRVLSDNDADVRHAAAAVLSTRGLDDRQIELGRKLVHADAAVRLSLLIDLPRAGDTVPDLGPWLARLSQDTDASVRAGAARLAFECRVPSAAWLDDLADRDADGLVRSIAKHYRTRYHDVRAAGGFAP